VNDPKRYEAMGPEVIATPTGEFVRWEDYARLRSVAEDNKTECEATRIENARLKAENEQLFFASQGSVKYVDHQMAFARQATEHHKEMERLKAEVERSRDQYNGIIDTQLKVIEELKAEVERHNKARQNDDMATSGKEDPLLIPRHLVVWWMDECKKAQAQVERLTKAGDVMASKLELDEKEYLERYGIDTFAMDVGPKVVRDWNAAKEGKQS
jgi:hypothetical protein